LSVMSGFEGGLDLLIFEIFLLVIGEQLLLNRRSMRYGLSMVYCKSYGMIRPLPAATISAARSTGRARGPNRGAGA